MRSDFRWLGLLLGGFLCSIASVAVVVSARGEEPASEQPATRQFSDRIEVRLLQVEVVVEDADGRRVEGLGRDRFRLFLGEEEIPIELFQEVRLEAGGHPDRDGKGTPAEAGPADETARADAGDVRESHSLLLFVDTDFSDRRVLADLLADLAEDLEVLGPRDRVAVVLYSGGAATLLAPWTSSAKEWKAALRVASPRATLQYLQWTSIHSGGAAEGPGAPPPTGSVNNLLYFRLQRVVSALAASLWGLSDVPGRKSLVLVSGGWNYLDASPSGSHRTAGDLPHLLEFGQWGGTGLLRPVVESANLLGWTIYPVLAGSGDPPARRASLIHFARATGGVVVGSDVTSGRGPLDRLFEDTRSYYLLAFTRERREDDERQRLRVEVAGEGLRARHRTVLRDPSRDFAQAMEREGAQWLDSPSRGLRVSVRSVERQRRRAAEVTFRLEIPPGWLTLLPAADVRARAVLQVQSFGKRGRSRALEVPVELQDEGLTPTATVFYDLPLGLRIERQRVVFLLRDEVSGETLGGVVDLDPGELLGGDQAGGPSE